MTLYGNAHQNMLIPCVTVFCVFLFRFVKIISKEFVHHLSQKRITICMDFVKGRCTREACRYFHPPSHLQSKLKTVKISQSQLSLVSKFHQAPCNFHYSTV